MSLKRLNWVIIGVIISTLILLTFGYGILKIDVNATVVHNDYSLHNLRRTNLYVQLASNVRTFILLANSVVNPLFSYSSLNALYMRQDFVYDLIVS